ncbi:MAG: MoaD/ThiS family protein [Dehalococcoidia bacterium]|nr:MoaD/ThiS family protein [Dehalococcoidia bacterium]
MTIKVHLYSSLQQFTNDRNMVEVSGSTIGECLNDLVKRFPKIKPVLFDKDGKLLGHIFVSVNLQSAYPEELAKVVNDGDELYIALIIAGG